MTGDSTNKKNGKQDYSSLWGELSEEEKELINDPVLDIVDMAELVSHSLKRGFDKEWILQRVKEKRLRREADK